MRRCLAILLLAASVTNVCAYSVLSHEAVIDAAWDRSIKPLLLARFPGATPEELLKAHAYAYGGCVIQDFGYYPFANRVVANLLHYVRAADFVQSLFRNAKNANEFAFAIGARRTSSATASAIPRPSIWQWQSNFPNSRQNTDP